MLSFDEALHRILGLAPRTGAEVVPLEAALGRVLANVELIAPIDVPPFANSAMDGFAVRALDTPGELPLVGEVAAGSAALTPLAPGTTQRIMTGAQVPPGADAIVPLEQAQEGPGKVRLPAAQPGAFTRLAGSDTPAGSTIRLEGLLGPASIAVLASLGIAEVEVRVRPRVAVVSTGDELVAPGTPLGVGQIYDANAPAIAAAIREAGGTPVVLPRLADDPAAIEAALADAAAHVDLVVTSGGVSVGRHDHVREVLDRRGSLELWRIAVQPGKPLAMGSLDGVPVMGLPGNPVSALVTFELFVRPLIRHSLCLPGSGRLHVRARPESAISKDPERRAFLRVVAWTENGEVHARSAGGQGSAQLRPLAAANALLIVPEGEPASDPSRSYETIVTGELA